MEPRNMRAVMARWPTHKSRREDLNATVLVSLCGDIPQRGLTVFADPGVDYDWSALRRLYAIVAVRKGIDATRVVQALDAICNPYVSILDVDSGQQAGVVALYPKLKLWRVA